MNSKIKQNRGISFQRGAAVIEYMGLIMFVLIAIVFFKDYIVRGFSGKWKLVGDGISAGRQYDPRPFGAQGEGGGTLDCYYETRISEWLSRALVEKNCDCTLPPEDPLFSTECNACLTAQVAGSSWCTEDTNF